MLTPWEILHNRTLECPGQPITPMTQKLSETTWYQRKQPQSSIMIKSTMPNQCKTWDPAKRYCSYHQSPAPTSLALSQHSSISPLELCHEGPKEAVVADLATHSTPPPRATPAKETRASWESSLEPWPAKAQSCILMAQCNSNPQSSSTLECSSVLQHSSTLEWSSTLKQSSTPWHTSIQKAIPTIYSQHHLITQSCIPWPQPNPSLRPPTLSADEILFNLTCLNDHNPLSSLSQANACIANQ